MKEIQYKELEALKEFKKEGKELVWCPFNIDHFMGFTICRIRATEGVNGKADFRFTEEYVMSGNSKEKECNDEKYLCRMKSDLEKLLIAL